MDEISVEFYSRAREGETLNEKTKIEGEMVWGAVISYLLAYYTFYICPWIF
jgi:hypothetical protein